MAQKHDTQRTVAPPERAQLRTAWGLLFLLVMLLAFQGGCREEATSGEALAVEVKPEKMTPQPVEAETSAPQEVPTRAPKLVFAKTVHDFGEIGLGTRNVCDFKFKNAGTAVLNVEPNIDSSCGCTVPKLTKTEYAPGEEGEINVTFSAGSTAATVKKYMTVHSNDPTHPTEQLAIVAKIAPRVSFEPTRLKLFTNAENAGAKDIVLTSLDGRPFSVKGFRATAGALTADFDPNLEATRIVLKPKVNMERLKRNTRGRIRIDLTHPECDNVSLLYDVLAEFTVDHEQIMLFNLQAGQPVKREVWVMSNYQKEFEIESVASQKGFVTLLDQRKQDSRYGLTLEITPPSVESDRAVMSDVVEVKIKGGTTLSIACRGFYQGK